MHFEGLLIYKDNEFVKQDERAQPAYRISQCNQLLGLKRSLSQQIIMNERLHGIIMVTDSIEEVPQIVGGHQTQQVVKELTYDRQDLIDQQLLEQIYENILK